MDIFVFLSSSFTLKTNFSSWRRGCKMIIITLKVIDPRSALLSFPLEPNREIFDWGFMGKENQIRCMGKQQCICKGTFGCVFCFSTKIMFMNYISCCGIDQFYIERLPELISSNFFVLWKLNFPTLPYLLFCHSVP